MNLQNLFGSIKASTLWAGLNITSKDSKKDTKWSSVQGVTR